MSMKSGGLVFSISFAPEGNRWEWDRGTDSTKP